MPSAAAQKGTPGGRSARNPRNCAPGLRKSAHAKRDRPKSRRMSRPTFEAPKVRKLPETSKGRNFDTSETRKLAKNDSGSCRIPSAAARKGALGDRSARNHRSCASGLRKSAHAKRGRPKSRQMSRPTFKAPKVRKLRNFRNFKRQKLRNFRYPETREK